MRFGNGSNKKDLKRRISARFRSCLVVSCNPALLLSLLYCSLVYGIAQHDTPTFRKRLPAVFRCIRDALCSCVGIGRKSQPFLPKPMRNGLFASIPAEILPSFCPKRHKRMLSRRNQPTNRLSSVGNNAGTSGTSTKRRWSAHASTNQKSPIENCKKILESQAIATYVRKGGKGDESCGNSRGIRGEIRTDGRHAPERGAVDGDHQRS